MRFRTCVLPSSGFGYATTAGGSGEPHTAARWNVRTESRNPGHPPGSRSEGSAG
ncbi:hypothetical protein KCH_31270 [Kitasatospora cheerisanensis KCTC 2395]|uniref:Uncharacterized protein n=1 Tax=Kitasatospora cheerisanensis KCTC 2395 TaxID=1348663 RepID=A0A066YTZ6_9ACTN|nr:hypothetical protein KCH_31270 [Kitasatospora cheerisanensis KCTC 2395]